MKIISPICHTFKNVFPDGWLNWFIQANDIVKVDTFQMIDIFLFGEYFHEQFPHSIFPPIMEMWKVIPFNVNS